MSLSNNALLAEIIASVAEGIVSIDDQLRIVLFNPAAEQMFGRSREEMNGQPLSTLIPERFRAQHDEHIRRFAAMGQTNRGMGRYGLICGLRANGEEFPIESTISQAGTPRNKVFTVILRDITRQLETEKQLREDYELLDRIFATTHFCVVYLDRDFNFVRVNKAYADACGHPPEFFPGENHFALYPDEKVKAIFRRVVDTREPFTIYANPFEFPDHPERGVTYWDWTLHPLKGEGGGVEGLLFALLDVTERKRAEHELERKVAFAQLLGSLAHTANEAATPEEAMKGCLTRLCDFGNWTLGRVAMTHELGGDFERPGDSIWHAADLARHEEFIRVSKDVYSFHKTGRFIAIVLREKRPVWISDINEPHGFLRRAAALADGLCAAFAFPVIVQGEVTAFLEFFADNPRPVEPSLIAASETIAAQLARLIERRRSERINAQLAAIVEHSNDAIVSLDLDRTILSWNAAAERLFGYSAAEIIGRKGSLMVPADQEAHAAQRRELLKDGISMPTYDTVRLGKGGRRVDVAVTTSPVKDPNGKMAGISLVLHDISERKRTEIEHAQLAAIVESSNDAILTRGPDRTILSWNAAAERLFGWSAQEAVGQPIDLILPPERLGLLQGHVEGLEKGEPLKPVDTTHLRKDGVRIPTQITFSPVRDKQGNVAAYSLTVRDMTENKRNEDALRGYAARLRELSRRLREVEETERRAISHELHDRIGQGLTTLSLMVGTLDARLPAESRSAVQTQLQDMQTLLRSVVVSVRDVMAELRPPTLDDYGLLAALRHLVTEFAKRTGIAVNLSGVDPNPRLPRIVETAMFRISQEALNNIVKHARAKNVEISLNSAPERVVLDIADDGTGFDANNIADGGEHWGMITMRERAEAVGIAFRLDSAPGAGTRIVLEVERAAS